MPPLTTVYVSKRASYATPPFRGVAGVAVTDEAAMKLTARARDHSLSGVSVAEGAVSREASVDPVDVTTIARDKPVLACQPETGLEVLEPTREPCPLCVTVDAKRPKAREVWVFMAVDTFMPKSSQ